MEWGSFSASPTELIDFDAESRTGCWGSLGANSSPVRRHANLPKCASATGPNVVGFSVWPRASCSSSHVGGMSGLLVAVARLAGRWCFWRLFSCFPGAGAHRWFRGFGFSFSVHAGHRADCLSGSFRVLIATGSSLKLRGTCITCRACGPTESLTSATASGC